MFARIVEPRVRPLFDDSSTCLFGSEGGVNPQTSDSKGKTMPSLPVSWEGSGAKGLTAPDRRACSIWSCWYSVEPLATRFRKDSAGGRRDKLRGFGGCWYSGTSLRGVVVRGVSVVGGARRSGLRRPVWRFVRGFGAKVRLLNSAAARFLASNAPATEFSGVTVRGGCLG